MSDLERSDPHESPPDNFGVDFNCDINTLYARLTEKPSKTHCRLSSNWKDISDVGDYFGNTYDVFGSIETTLSSSLKILSVPEIGDRNSRLIEAEAVLYNSDRSPWENRVAAIISESTRLGIDLSFVDPGPNPEQDHQKGWLVPQNPELKWAIRFTNLKRSNWVNVVYPFREHLDLEGHQTVQNILQTMSSAIEHTLRVCYAVEGKSLPEERLNFFPYVKSGEAKEMLAFATCSYCGSNYSKLHVKCPSCGA